MQRPSMQPTDPMRTQHHGASPWHTARPPLTPTVNAAAKAKTTAKTG